MSPGPRHRDRLVPTELAALAAGVTEATIRKWASRGKLTRYGSPGRAQYDLDELVEPASIHQSRRADPGVTPVEASTASTGEGPSARPPPCGR